MSSNPAPDALDALRLADATSGPYQVSSLKIEAQHDALHGRVVWDPWRSLWNAGMLIGTLWAFSRPQWQTTLPAIALLLLTLCAGHSIGFHRRLIHRTFQCSRGFERLLVWLGTLVGMQGPFWVILSHDLRDWAQRQRDCHPYLRHGQGWLKDGFWALHCKLVLDRPPPFDPGPGIADDPFHRFLQRSWMAQQLPFGLLGFWLGGWTGVAWLVCARVTLGVTAHWFVGYLCHTHGPQDWHVCGGAVQAHNVGWAAWPSFGESWHNNHHAFPGSARHGLYPEQTDLGFRLLRWMERRGWVWAIQTPDTLPPRPGLEQVGRPLQ